MSQPSNINYIKSTGNSSKFNIYPTGAICFSEKSTVHVCLYVLRMYNRLHNTKKVPLGKGAVSLIHRKNSVFALIPSGKPQAKSIIVISAERHAYTDAGKCLEDSAKLYALLKRMGRHFDKGAIAEILKVIKRHNMYLCELKKLELLKETKEKNEVDLQRLTFAVCKHIESLSLGAWKLEYIHDDTTSGKVYMSNVSVMLYAGVLASAIRELLCDSVSEKISVKMEHKNDSSILFVTTKVSAQCDVRRLSDRLLYIFSGSCDDVGVTFTKHCECCVRVSFKAYEEKRFKIGAETDEKERKLYDLSGLSSFLGRISYLNGYIDDRSVRDAI